MVNNCSLPEIIEIKTSLLPSGDGNGSKFCAWVICTGIEIALSAAAAACSDASEIASRTEKKVRRRREELRREVTIALLAMKLSQSKEVERTKTVKSGQLRSDSSGVTDPGYSWRRMRALRLFLDCAADFSQVFPEGITQDRLLASPDTAQTPTVPAASVRF